MAAAAVHSALLSRLPGIRHAFFTRRGGVSEGVYASLNGGTGSNDDQAKVRENRARMAAAVGVAPENFLTCYQIHSPDVVTVETPWTADARPRADAMVTRMPNIALGISTADCGPVLFADAEAQVIGGAHAGWRGAFTGVIEATIEGMEKLGAKRSRIVAALGPMIRRENYEVGPEFLARFEQADQRTRASSRPRNARTTQCSICPVTSRSACAMPASSKSTISASAPAATRTASIVTGA